MGLKTGSILSLAELTSNWLIENFNQKEGIDLSTDIQALQRLTEAAEKAKMELSTVEKTKISLPFITADQTGPKHIDQELTRDVFEKLCGFSYFVGKPSFD